MKSLTRAEQETVIRFDAEEQIAHIDTANPATIRKLDKLAAEHPDTYRCVRVDPEYLAKRYTVPASFVRFGKPASEARKAQAARMRAKSRNQ
jgi:hypothetical protein